MNFRITRWFQPTRVEDLDAIRQKQLRLAGKLYDGADLPIEERLPDDPDSESATKFYGILEWRELIDDKSGVLVDAWLAGSDSGTYFKAGTVEVIAELHQDFAEARDSTDQFLGEALTKVSRWPIPKAMGARKEPPSQSSAPTSAAKPAKKAPATKKTGAAKTKAKKAAAKKARG